MLDWKAIVTRRDNADFFGESESWAEWRLTYLGGRRFRDRYLERFSERESDAEYTRRKAMTPVSTPAKSAINKIKNSVFRRFPDILRSGGSPALQAAIVGEDSVKGVNGIDGRGSSMNAFLGQKVLPDLLVMGKVGVYVDAPKSVGATAAEAREKSPYIYAYAVEQILDICSADTGSPSDWSFVLLAEVYTKGETHTGKADQVRRFKFVWVDEKSKKVYIQYLLESGEEDGPTIKTELDAIPFVLFDIGDSLIKDACTLQIAMMNMSSHDTSYALDSNYPFLTRQKETRNIGEHLKEEDDAETVEAGSKKGVFYPPKMERPGFISPPSEPLLASLQLRKNLREEIYECVNLALENVNMNDPGLDSGLSFIGLMLEKGEKRVYDHWAAYEQTDPARRLKPVVKYPEQWSVVPDLERIEVARELTSLTFEIPGMKVKKALMKMAASKLLRGYVASKDLIDIVKDIDDAPYSTSSPDIILACKEQGVCGGETASIAMGFAPGEYAKAEADHAKRLAELQASQTGPDGELVNPAARGVDDKSANPAGGAEEKELSRDTTEDDTTEDKTRGEAK